MEQKLVPASRLDALDREAFRQLVESEPFRLLQSRVDAELKRATRTCISSPDQLEVMRAQGAAGALEAVLLLPQRLLDEMTRHPK